MSFSNRRSGKRTAEANAVCRMCHPYRRVHEASLLSQINDFAHRSAPLAEEIRGRETLNRQHRRRNKIDLKVAREYGQNIIPQAPANLLGGTAYAMFPIVSLLGDLASASRIPLAMGLGLRQFVHTVQLGSVSRSRNGVILAPLAGVLKAGVRPERPPHERPQ
jgi:hypothetical protein